MVVNDLTENYTDLANGIVLQAAEDYRKCLDNRPIFKTHRRVKGKDIKMLPEEIERMITNEKRNIAKFFRSSYFETLTNVNGAALLEKINEDWVLEQSQPKKRQEK